VTRRSSVLPAILGFILGLSPAALASQTPAPAEDGQRASFLPKFPRYVTWPQAMRLAPGAAFQLCVIGRDPFGRALDAAAAGEQIDGHGVAVRRLADSAGAGACHLAYVRGADAIETDRLLLALRNQPVLTVTDADSGPQRGMIHFATLSGRTRFFINEAEAAQRGLTISSRLLALAAGVTQRR
jgi:hypothetical protein